MTRRILAALSAFVVVSTLQFVGVLYVYRPFVAASPTGQPLVPRALGFALSMALLVLFFVWVAGQMRHPLDARYDGYTSPDRARIGGREFIADGFAYPSDAQARPGSDRERAKAMLTRQGFHFPAEVMTRRMVHLPTPEKRQELLIIYIEDLAPTGFTVSDLAAGRPHAAEWPRLARELQARALAGIAGR